ncbi:MAG: uroporphyrinogen decarboxylase [Halobacteriales archaeon]|nr:uroporphyrinogen decarboxylase [Halobacteriales archaeon]
MNGRERFLRACHGKPVDATPVWFMRQAGRYLPEYRELRKRHPILEMATTPDLAVEVAMQPMRRFDLDASILFADIVLPLRAMGSDVDLVDSVGPVVAHAVRTEADVANLRGISSAKDLGFVMETVRRLVIELAGEKALIGFSGAPFTLASYLIEGKPSREFIETKRFMHEQPEAWRALMDKLTEAVSGYLREQVIAGVDAVQLFDSWAGHLSPTDYAQCVAPYTARILADLEPLGAPRIHFATPTAGLLDDVARLDCEVNGLDWRVSLRHGWSRLGKSVQGNLDPAVLASSASATTAEAHRILRDAGGRPGHIFNLGHGILPMTPPENVKLLVETVHSSSRAMLEAMPA